MSDAFDALSAQTASEAAQSLFADPSSLVFMQHKALFGCPTTAEHSDLIQAHVALREEHTALGEEHTALQQELAATQARIAELEGRPVSALPPASAPGGPSVSLELFRGALASLDATDAREFALVVIRCCWKARIPLPSWLLDFQSAPTR